MSLQGQLHIENQSLRKGLESVKATLEAKDEVIKIMSSLIEDFKKLVSSK